MNNLVRRYCFRGGTELPFFKVATLQNIGRDERRECCDCPSLVVLRVQLVFEGGQGLFNQPSGTLLSPLSTFKGHRLDWSLPPWPGALSAAGFLMCVT